MTDNSPVAVVYVMGSGRSGTTLMDTILSNHQRMYGAGELAMLTENNLYHRMYCPCGHPADGCCFWTEVVKSWFARARITDLSEHARIRRRFEGARLNGLASLLREKLFRSNSFAEYARQTTELYRAIRDVSGRDIIVDSSVIPMRALALSLMPEIDLKVIHIIRDSRGVAWSLKKGLREDQKAGIGTSETPRPVWRSAITWMMYNLTSSWVCSQVPKGNAHFCRYEDLSTNSELTLRSIAEFLGCDLEEIILRIKAGDSLKVGCTFGGNRMRMNGAVRLRLDTDWREKLTSTEKRTLSRMCGWLMRRYGYPVDAATN